ncbi:MAG: amino acid kinase family protein [Candidatus Helarchaeota archaeon]
MDAVIKIGGSLLKKDSIQNLCQYLDKLKAEFTFVILPGGGEFADLVRKYYKLYQNTDDSAHWMAILCENILGYLMLDFLEFGKPVFTISEIKKAIRASLIPVFLPFPYLLDQDPLPHSWDITSDSIAAYLAEQLQAEKIILLKDVDGIYTHDPKQISPKEAILLPFIKINTIDLTSFHSCIDKYLPTILREFPRDCYIVNGLYPERLGKILRNEKTIYSKIVL